MNTIRPIQKTDLQQIAKIHIDCFPHSFSSSIGERLLAKYYGLFFSKYPNLFFGAFSNHLLVGFVMGYMCGEPNISKQFIKKYFLPLSFQIIKGLVTFDKRVWSKLFHKHNNITEVSQKYVDINKRLVGDLLSICVLSSHRRMGIADSLEKSFCEALKKSGKKYCTLSARKENEAGNNFYLKKGYLIFKQSNEQYYFIKEL